jgi:D-alanyl-lipoteichoic acid acyltransferase DltB (MBOAT superfamily)
VSAVPSFLTPTALGRLTVIGVQLALVVFLAAEFHIENAAFATRVLPIAAGGFLIHHFLSPTLRLPFFAGLSTLTVLAVLGPAQGAWLLALGGLLIAIAHLPLRFALRVVLLLVVGAGLGAARVGVVSIPWSGGIWPILGSMFMFRLIAYMYDLRHQKEPTNLARTLAYFFCLPNVAFPLFPVIDFATFRRTYFDRDAFAIYQQGIHWMVRGLIHLVAYRIVYRYATLSPNDVATGADLVRYMLANFALYLRVSGQFHLIVGMLHLFGFRLPETHRFFFLAASFPDFWRRINIYWKDFMTKVFYMPAFFKLKARGETFAIVASTLVVFVATWLLHSYQWFWILGTWLLSWTDTLFWGILALFLVVGALHEARRGRLRTTRSTQRTWRDRARVAIGTVTTFAILCTLWTLWTSPTLPEFFLLMTAPQWALRDVAIVASVVIAVALASWWGQWREQFAARGRAMVGPRHALLGLAPIGVLWSLGQPQALHLLDAKTQEFAVATRNADLNRQDQDRLQRGYYERIVGVNAFGGQLWRLYAPRPRDWWNLEARGVTERLISPLLSALKPNVRTVINGTAFSTNQWGMRDRDYSRVKPPAVTRLAVLGASYVMGMGVADGETFEAIVEKRLNEDAATRGSPPIEILNFAITAASLQQQLALLESAKMRDFGIEDVVIFGHVLDVKHGTDYLYDISVRGLQPSADTMRALMRAAGWDSSTNSVAARRIMQPFEKSLVAWTMHRIVEVCREQGLRCTYAFLPLPLEARNTSDHRLLLDLASAAGLEVADFGNVYAGYDEHELTVAEWDRHPNARGHRIIADRFYRWLTSKPDLVSAPQPASP